MVLTGSAAGRGHLAGSFYGATKSFMHGYADNLAEDMKDYGERCTVIAPGTVSTAPFRRTKVRQAATRRRGRVDAAGAACRQYQRCAGGFSDAHG